MSLLIEYLRFMKNKTMYFPLNLKRGTFSTVFEDNLNIDYVL